jgi:hypothetical protein
MIVFVAPFPALSDEKDGMMQRVASIDLLVSDLPRTYLDISFRRFWSMRTHHFGEVTVLQLNGLLHLLTIVSWLKKASVVYIHSVFNAFSAMPAYWFARPITDLHGVVPEELVFQGYRGRAFFFDLIERIVLRRSAVVVHVTEAMQRHFRVKYQRHSAADLIISILPNLTDDRGQCKNILVSNRDPKAVIYAGGLQAWQNVSMMLDAAAATPKLNFVFLSGEAPALKRLAELKNIANFTCKCVAPSQVANSYLTTTYGFILRDAIVVNQVACPTKLVEYLYWGVIPIVLTPDIGDFNERGFAFVSLVDFKLGRLPDVAEADRIRVINRKIAEELVVSCEDAVSALRQLFLKN